MTWQNRYGAKLIGHPYGYGFIPDMAMAFERSFQMFSASSCCGTISPVQLKAHLAVFQDGCECSGSCLNLIDILEEMGHLCITGRLAPGDTSTVASVKPSMS